MKQNHRKRLSVLFLSFALLGGCAANKISTQETTEETSALKEENNPKEEVTQSVTGETYTATQADESAIDVSGSETLTSQNSRAVIIEGKNSVTLNNCILSGNDQSTKEGSVKANVLLYQSASGDAENGTSSFTMTNGSMTSLSGAMFYCTNTASVITLENTELNLTDENILLIVSEGRWGKDGSNGGDCTMTVSDQALTGDITVDAISLLDLTLENCDYTGAILSEGETALTLGENSTWTLTADSYLTEFNGDLSQVNFNGFTLYLNGNPVTQ